MLTSPGIVSGGLISAQARRHLSSVTDAYLSNYDRIASDHVAAWRENGLNPFQPRAVVEANENTTLNLIHRYVPTHSLVLDAGCGMGDLMLRMRTDYQVRGVEIASPYCVVLAERELEWTQSPLEDLEFEDDSFDAVIATDVLEHVIDIHAAAKELTRVLRPGGTIIVRTPNMEPIGEGGEYEFVHLRILDEGTLRALFGRLFGYEVLEAFVEGEVVHLAARR